MTSDDTIALRQHTKLHVAIRCEHEYLHWQRTLSHREHSQHVPSASDCR